MGNPRDWGETCAAIGLHKVAISADRRYLITALNPHLLQIERVASGEKLKSLAIIDKNNKSSAVSGVYSVPARKSFFVALADIAEIWQISYADEPPIGFGGWVHDYRVDSGENTVLSAFPLQRIHPGVLLQNFFIDRDGISLLGITAEGKAAVVDLDLGRIVIPELQSSPNPHPGAAMQWDYQGVAVLALPDRKEGVINLFNIDGWKMIKQIKIPGPGQFMPHLSSSLLAVLRITAGPEHGRLLALEKATLTVVAHPQANITMGQSSCISKNVDSWCVCR